MTRHLLAATTIALAALAAAGCGGGGGGASLASSDIAVVCGQHVSKARYATVLNQEKAQLQGKLPKVGTADYEKLKEQIVQVLAQKAAYEKKYDDLVAAAEKRVKDAPDKKAKQSAQNALAAVRVTDKDVTDKLNEIITTQFGGKKKTFIATIKKQGLSEADARDIVRFQAIETRLHDSIVGPVAVTTEDERAYFEKNKATFAQPESRSVAHILVKTKAEADKVEQQLANGGNFTALAKKLSTDTSSAPSGGQLVDKKGTFVPEFEAVAFKLKTGEVSQPVKSQFGWHIIKALAPVQKAQPASFKTAQTQIEATLKGKKQQEAVTKWVNDVQKECIDKATYAPGYAPPKVKPQQTTTPVVTSTG
jgi:foldase protein PrsA